MTQENSSGGDDATQASKSTNDTVLESIFNLIVMVLENMGNRWLKPSEIASFLCKAGVSNDLNGFHVALGHQKVHSSEHHSITSTEASW
jgi:hypothetical protein